MSPGYRYGNARLVTVERARASTRRRRRKSRERREHVTRIYSGSITGNDYQGRAAASAVLLRGAARILYAEPADAPRALVDLFELDGTPKPEWHELGRAR